MRRKVALVDKAGKCHRKEFGSTCVSAIVILCNSINIIGMTAPEKTEEINNYVFIVEVVWVIY